MVFSSLPFLYVYLPIVIAGYYGVPHLLRLTAGLSGKKTLNVTDKLIFSIRNVWLFAVNLIFYAWGEPVYVLLMLFSITFNFGAGLLINSELPNRKSRAKIILIACIVLNLALLGVFKYLDLFLVTFGVAPIGLTLPIGISFYTFQTMTYPIDLYRQDCSVQRNYVKFGTYVALFPQLIAGPIVRYRDVAKQLDHREHSDDKFERGIERFAVGLAKKVLIANNLGQLWSHYSSFAPAQLTAADAWLGIAAFSFQIYFDFSGYSDMAIGLGRMFGFKFLENFNYPYVSRSITEFWRRWHMSLGTWFRDYVYIPLGGSKRGILRQLLNIAIVWALTGFWHGAAWNFLLWGAYYAVLLIVEKTFLLKLLERTVTSKPLKWLQSVASHGYTLLAVVIGWALFAVEDFSALRGYLSAMFGANGGVSSDALYWLRNYAAVFVIAAVASTPLLTYRFIKPIRTALVMLVLLLCTAYLVNSSFNPFLYFRF